jgi:hypothetical protein
VHFRPTCDCLITAAAELTVRIMSTAATVEHAPSRLRWIHSTRLHAILYAFIAVGMPFLMLRAYLQERIGELSASTYQVWGIELPWMPTLALAVGIPALLLLARHINRGHVFAAAVIFLMIAYAQYINDYYFGHRFYELQMNWHYFGYMLFGIMVYRDLAPRGRSPAYIIRFTFIAALLFSTFDESFQSFINNRVFDSGDISKDVWGSLMGVLFMYSGKHQFAGWRPIRHRRLSEYFQYPGSTFILLGTLSFSLLTYSSLLNDHSEVWQVVCLALATFGLVFALLHLSQFRPVAWGLLALAVLALGAQAWAFAKYRDSGMVYWQPGLAVYRGFVWPYFDFAILPDGTFHPATKLHRFNPRDRLFFLRQRADIILVAAGPQAEGGDGFYDKKTHFMYNPNLKRGSQIIILPTDQACRVFNRLKKEGKNVLFVVNND